MKLIAYLIAVAFPQAAIAQPSRGGFVGLALSTTDYDLVSGITPGTVGSPIHVGDRIVSFGSVPVAHIHNIVISGRLPSALPAPRLSSR
ncbi:MAG: hypothetical protein QOK24_240 [Verrucomicrobiota bacterium]|jgi:hypothetical protein